MSDPSALYDTISEEAHRVLIGNDDVVRHLTISLLTRGHVLLEGVPGVSKTTIARLFARTTGLSSNRIQMTPDTLPADITGSYVFQQDTGEFDLRKGPIFANLVIADEINRATPKTQSALLEAMQEGYATIEGETLSLPDPFLVIATQNPIEQEGTFALPEAQRDRFQVKLIVDIPDEADEIEILDRFDENPELDADDVDQVVTTEEIKGAQEVVAEVYVDDRIKAYIRELAAATREHADVAHGVSPRAALDLLDASKAQATLEGRSYVIPDDVKLLTGSVFSHRLVLNTEASIADIDARTIIEDTVSSVEPPGSDVDFSESSAERAAADGGT